MGNRDVPEVTVNLGLPDRYVALAVSAYDQELLSESEVAEMLATDVATARGVYQQRHRIALENGTELQVDFTGRGHPTSGAREVKEGFPSSPPNDDGERTREPTSTAVLRAAGHLATRVALDLRWGGNFAPTAARPESGVVRGASGRLAPASLRVRER